MKSTVQGLKSEKLFGKYWVTVVQYNKKGDKKYTNLAQ